jgi:hypothetical protein
MKHNDFRIGEDFWCNAVRWRCTDIGTRTIIAIRLDRVDVVQHPGGEVTPLTEAAATADDWFNGPPYAVVEHAFDEDDIVDCAPEPDEAITVHLKGRDLDVEVELPALLTAGIWRGVRRGEIPDVEQYIRNLLMGRLDKPSLAMASKVSAKAEDIMNRYGNTLSELK